MAAHQLPHPWDSPGKNTGVGCHVLLQCMKVKSESEVAQCVQLLATPGTAAYQAPPSMGFSRQEYWSGLPLPSPRCRVCPNCSWVLWIFLKLLCGEGNGTPLQYSCLENPMDGGAWWAAVHGGAKSRTRLSDFTFMPWRRKWQPTPVFLPGESQGWGSLVGCRLWGCTELDTTEAT